MNLFKSVFPLMLSGLCIAANAQTPLSGVNSVDILVESLDDSAAKCGITKDGLDAAVRLPLSNSRVRVSSAAEPYLYVNANVLLLGEKLCVVGLQFNFNKFVPAEGGTGAFWGKGTISSGGGDYVSKVTYSSLENFTKQFIAAWLKAN